jgi:hypothetical protein
MEVIYIAGYYHCASTLLDVFFSSLRDTVGLGEISRAEEEKDRRRFRIEELKKEYREWWEFALWGRLNIVLKEERKNTGIISTLQGEGGMFGDQFFREAGQYFGVTRVIDSSKTPPKNILRPEFLMRSGLNVKVVHPVRDPITLFNSYYRKGRRGVKFYMYILTGWVLSNLFTFLLYRGEDYCMIKYWDIMRNPEHCVKVIGEKIGVDVSIVEDRLDRGAPFEQGGGFLGNGMRRERKIYFDPPSCKKTSLPKHLKVMAWMGYPLYSFLEEYMALNN